MAVTNYYNFAGLILAEATLGVRTDYLSDSLGSVVATVDNSSSIVNTYRYKPYGLLLAKTGAASDPAFRWVGTEGYRQTGRNYSDMYIRARHYDAAIGRWSTKDPINLSGNDHNLYRYAHNNPESKVDPTGLRCMLQPNNRRVQQPNNPQPNIQQACETHARSGAPLSPCTSRQNQQCVNNAIIRGCVSSGNNFIHPGLGKCCCREYPDHACHFSKFNQGQNAFMPGVLPYPNITSQTPSNYAPIIKSAAKLAKPCAANTPYSLVIRGGTAVTTGSGIQPAWRACPQGCDGLPGNGFHVSFKLRGSRLAQTPYDTRCVTSVICCKCVNVAPSVLPGMGQVTPNQMRCRCNEPHRGANHVLCL